MVDGSSHQGCWILIEVINFSNPKDQLNGKNVFRSDRFATFLSWKIIRYSRSIYSDMVFYFFTFIVNATINLINRIYHECERMEHHVIIFWKDLIITHSSLINIRLHQTSMHIHASLYAIHGVTQVMMY